MKVLVTGNKGFIATHLINTLKNTFENIIIDGFEINEDSSQYKHNKYDYIFHLASIARSVEVDFDPFGISHNSNVELTKIILSDFNYDKIIFASSCAIYGNNKTRTAARETDLLDPFCIYAVQKLISEKYVDYYSKLKKTPSVCLRFFNVYGEGQSQFGSYPNVMAAMLRTYKNEGYVIADDDGEQTRDFVHVSDIVNGIIKSMDIEEGNHIYNLCTNVETSINDIALMLTNDKNKIKRGPKRNFDIKYQVGDYSKAEKYLKWEPKIKLEEGIKRVLEDEGLF